MNARNRAGAEWGRRRILRQAGMLELCRTTRGAARVRIALIDGPILRSHPALKDARIIEYPQVVGVEAADPAHATFIASLLVGRSLGVLGIAPDCTLLSLAVQDEAFQDLELPASEAARRIACAIQRAIDLQADLIQLSSEFLPQSDSAFAPVVLAIARAASLGICTVVAAGNQPRLGASRIMLVSGVLPVAAATADGSVHPTAPLSPAIGRGIRSPGVGLPGATTDGGVGERSGSSFAAALVSGTLALMKGIHPRLSTLHIAAKRPRPTHSSMVPPMLDGAAWHSALPPIELEKPA